VLGPEPASPLSCEAALVEDLSGRPTQRAAFTGRSKTRELIM
jgi:hypothetical protein